jgi:hypothetical protein
MTKTIDLLKEFEKKSKRAVDLGNLIGFAKTLESDLENYVIPKVENRGSTHYDRNDIARDLNEILKDLKDLIEGIDKIEI